MPWGLFVCQGRATVDARIDDVSAKRTVNGTLHREHVANLVC